MEICPFSPCFTTDPKEENSKVLLKVVTAIDLYIYNTYYYLLSVSGEGKKKEKEKDPKSAAQHRQRFSSR